MAENCSQDSLPLSQETCAQLLSLIGGPISNLMEDDTSRNQDYATLVNDVKKIQAVVPAVNGYSNIYPQAVLQNENVFQNIEYEEDSMQWGSVGIPCENNENVAQENFIEQKRPVSSLLGSENWPGEFSFTISFNEQKATKGVSWIYSSEKNKLYVNKNFPCPVNFSANIPSHEELFIRAVALYTSPEFAYEKVHRCVNHSIDDIRKNMFEAEHFVRCESKNAYYENDPDTDRHSVIVPYENPPAGQDYSTYLYKFMCFGSCAGGPNRRELRVVFTLERRNGEVLGRQKIELKVCACPMRDFNSEEKKPVLKEQKIVKKRKAEHLPAILELRKAQTDHNIETFEVSDDFSMLKTPKKEKGEPKEYIIKTTNKNRYKFLKKMETIHILYEAAKSQPHWRHLLHTSSQSSSSGELDAF